MLKAVAITPLDLGGIMLLFYIVIVLLFACAGPPAESPPQISITAGLNISGLGSLRRTAAIWPGAPTVAK
jgi:hypothetical protein